MKQLNKKTLMHVGWANEEAADGSVTARLYINHRLVASPRDGEKAEAKRQAGEEFFARLLSDAAFRTTALQGPSADAPAAAAPGAPASSSSSPVRALSQAERAAAEVRARAFIGRGYVCCTKNMRSLWTGLRPVRSRCANLVQCIGSNTPCVFRLHTTPVYTTSLHVHLTHCMCVLSRSSAPCCHSC